MVRGATVEETVFEKPAKDDDGLAYLAESAKATTTKATDRAPTERELLKKEDSVKAAPAPAKTAQHAGPPPKKIDRIGYWKLYQYSSRRDKC